VFSSSVSLIVTTMPRPRRVSVGFFFIAGEV
jgi:hypothetical protein